MAAGTFSISYHLNLAYDQTDNFPFEANGLSFGSRIIGKMPVGQYVQLKKKEIETYWALSK